MHYSQINTHTERTVYPLDKQEEQGELCNKNTRCYHSGSRTKEKIIYQNDTLSTYNEIFQDYNQNKTKDKCIILKPASTPKIVFYKFHRFTDLSCTQSMPIESVLCQGQQEQASAESRRRNTKDRASLTSCLLCKKLQRPHATQSSICFIRFLLFSILIKLFPLLILFVRSSRSKQVKRVRQECISKAMIRLLIHLTRLLCVLQMMMAPTSSAVESTVPQERNAQFSSMPLFYNNSTMAKMMQASQQDEQVKNLVVKSHELDIIASSPAPVFAAFSLPGQTPALTPVDSRIIDFVNRDNILKQFQQKVSTTVNQDPAVESTVVRLSSSFSSSCSTCQLRKAKNDSLESIKLHILSKLQLKESPKIDVPRDVPQNIIDDYYKKFDRNGRRRALKSTSASSQLDSKQSYDSKEDYMQSDDPNAYYESNGNSDIKDSDDNDENDDEVHSRLKSVYIFPTAPRMRHNKKGDLLSFRYDNKGDFTITRAFLHLYIRGWDWIAEHEPDLAKRLRPNSTVDRAKELVVNIHRAVRRSNSANYTHTIPIAESRQYIPSKQGNWITIEIENFTAIWTEGREPHQVLLIKTPETWMRHFVVTGIVKNADNKIEKESELTAHIEVQSEYKAGRQKRSTSLDCQESDNEVRCCRYPLKVNFTSFGWTFVVAPTDFDAFFCSGECKLGYLEQYTHTHIASLSRSASPCCSPTKMSALTLLYFNYDQDLVLSTIPNMTVEKCSCS